MNTCCLIFLRYPESGKAKTRLIPALGDTGAARFYRLMAEHVCELCHQTEIDIRAYITPAEQMVSAQCWLGEDVTIREQHDGDLGMKLHAAFETAFVEGYSRVFAIGTDCVTLTDETLLNAARALGEHDITIGPSTDGGYYLIGMSQFAPEVFRDIPWSTVDTYTVTMNRIRELGLHYHLLEELSDVDTPKDLESLPDGWQQKAESCRGAQSVWPT